MDDADEREAFLKAIFDAPADDLPRLVFADWLDERGECSWAEFIRLECYDPEPSGQLGCPKGIFNNPMLAITADQLADAAVFRRLALREHPEWYGATEFKLTRGLIQSGKLIQTLLTSPVTARIVRFDLCGSLTHFGGPSGESGEETTAIALLREYEYRPVVTVQAVEALVNAREARRMTHLDLRNNDLDNDAARAIVNSKNLIRLQSLHLFDGNQLRGRTWQQLLERFGPDVVQ